MPSIMDELRHNVHIHPNRLEYFSHEMPSQKPKRKKDEYIHHHKSENISNDIIDRISRFSYKYLENQRIRWMTPLIKYHSIISCYASCCEIDEKIRIAQGIYFYSFSSHSEFFTHDFSTSIYLYQIYPDFWATRTSLSSFTSILCSRLYTFYLFFKVIDRDLLFEDIP